MLLTVGIQMFGTVRNLTADSTITTNLEDEHFH